MAGNPRQAVFLALALGIVLGGGAYLALTGAAGRIDTDVGGLLPRDEVPVTRVLRSLASERQGRLVYLSVEAPDWGAEARAAVGERLEARLAEAAVVDRFGRWGEGLGGEAFRYADERKFALLFPKWLSRKWEAAQSAGVEEDDFAAWAAAKAVEDLDAFFESPMAMQLGRVELVDPLLLSVGALQLLMERGDLGGKEGEGDPLLFWLELDGSPLLPEKQIALQKRMGEIELAAQELHSSAKLEYGGLARLAAASRERIQQDVGKINGLSLAAVLVVSLLLVRPFWRVAWAAAVVPVAFVGAATVALLAFGRISVVVLVIGSILIGTSVDYAFHTVFAKPPAAGFPTRKLLLFACLSTMVGFGLLLASEMELLRQIGVFVAAGLLSAFVAAQALPTLASRSRPGSKLEGLRLPGWLGLGLLGAAALALSLRLITAGGIEWKDDIRDLEAPNPEVEAADLALRERFGYRPGQRLALSMGPTLADALEGQARFRGKLVEAGVAAEELAFGPSAMLPTRSDVDLSLRLRSRLPRLFAELHLALQEGGYEVEAFAGFFSRSHDFLNTFANQPFLAEQALQGFAQRLEGPLSAMLDRSGDLSWATFAMEVDSEIWQGALAASPATVDLSQATALSGMLSELRERMARLGLLALLVVGLALLVFFGWRRGAVAIGLPALALALALSIASWATPPLNLFHLIGCFLGAALALDYALFGLEGQRRGEGLPYSVWLSSATTSASFLALTASYIEGVRALGLTVALITLSTLLLLLAVGAVSQAVGRSTSVHR